MYSAVAGGIAPVLAPAGFGNDHAAAVLMTGFMAKEVVVGSFAQSYAVSAPDDPARAGSLGERLRGSFDKSYGGHGGAAALAFMVFVLAYTPCVAALAEQRRLFGWRPTATAVVVQLPPRGCLRSWCSSWGRGCERLGCRARRCRVPWWDSGAGRESSRAADAPRTGSPRPRGAIGCSRSGGTLGTGLRLGVSDRTADAPELCGLPPFLT